MVDLSHLNETGFWDVARAEPGPLVASHSGVHALAASTRNLTDEQLDAIGVLRRTGRDHLRLSSSSAPTSPTTRTRRSR